MNMDNNIEWVLEQKIKRTMDALEKNNMESYFVKDEKALIEKINEFVKDGETVSVGGSMTLFETGVIDFLRCGRFNFLDRYKENLTPQDTKNIYRKSFMADTYFVSSNAVTEQGELYNVDGTGNRTAAMIYGPDKVIVIVGVNKIVSNLDEAIHRNRNCSAPANAKRLNRNTPCTKLGYCMDCNSNERICNDYVLIRRQGQKGRIKVIVVGKNLGY
jgi:L-lactate utilization protein LutB